MIEREVPPLVEPICELLERAAAGDDCATTALHGRFFGPLTGFARRRGADDAESVASIAFERTIARLPQFLTYSERAFRAYLYRTARNLIIDESRVASSRATRVCDPHPALTQLADPRETFETGIIDRTVVDELLEGLTGVQREVIELRFFEDLTLDQTATRTGQSLTAVKGTQRRALIAMRTALVAATAIALLIVGWRLVNDRDVTEVPVISDSELPPEPGSIPPAGDLEPVPDSEPGDEAPLIGSGTESGSAVSVDGSQPTDDARPENPVPAAGAATTSDVPQLDPMPPLDPTTEQVPAQVQPGTPTSSSATIDAPSATVDPAIPQVQIPTIEVPTVPAIPTVSAVAPIPTIPPIPTPDIPQLEAPTIPQIQIPTIEVPTVPPIPTIPAISIPDMSQFEAPAIPEIQIPTIEIPTVPPIPTIPAISIPDMSRFEAPAIPEIQIGRRRTIGSGSPA